MSIVSAVSKVFMGNRLPAIAQKLSEMRTLRATRATDLEHANIEAREARVNEILGYDKDGSARALAQKRAADALAALEETEETFTALNEAVRRAAEAEWSDRLAQIDAQIIPVEKDLARLRKDATRLMIALADNLAKQGMTALIAPRDVTQLWTMLCQVSRQAAGEGPGKFLAPDVANPILEERCSTLPNYRPISLQLDALKTQRAGIQSGGVEAIIKEVLSRHEVPAAPQPRIGRVCQDLTCINIPCQARAPKIVSAREDDVEILECRHCGLRFTLGEAEAFAEEKKRRKAEAEAKEAKAAKGVAGICEYREVNSQCPHRPCDSSKAAVVKEGETAYLVQCVRCGHRYEAQRQALFPQATPPASTSTAST